MSLSINALLAALVCALGAGRVTSSTAPSATVRFVIVAPLCSSVVPVEFSIDRQRVGADTFRVDVNSPHTVSQPFTVSPGRHTVGARVVNGHIWPDTSVTVAAGAGLLDSLPFYCS